MSKQNILYKIIQITLEKPTHEEWRISKNLIPHPISMGFYPSVGDLYGQIADYRVALADGRGIHSREYKFIYGFHWDNKDSSLDPLGHLIEDAPHWLIILVLGGITVGALCWAAYSSRQKRDK